LKENASPDIAGLLTGLNDKLNKTRGAAAGLAFAQAGSRSVTCAGIGNIIIRRCGGRRELIYPCPDGVLGVRFRTPRLETFHLDAGELLLIYSDGVIEDFKLPTALTAGSLTVETIARRVVLDYGRLYDDAGCIVLRYES
jgi:hypothetical protein